MLLVRDKNLQTFAVEIFKLKTRMTPELMDDIFHFVKRPYKLQNSLALQRKSDNTVFFGCKSPS